MLRRSLTDIRSKSLTMGKEDGERRRRFFYAVQGSRRVQFRRLASHADVAGLAAGILLGVDCGQAHDLVAADLSYRAQAQIHGVSVDDLQDKVLCVVEHQLAVFILGARHKVVVGEIQRWQALLAELVSRRALWCDHQNDIVIGCIHAVEVGEIQVCLGAEELLGWQLEAVAAVWRVLWGFACVELGVATEEDALELPADGRTMAAAVVLH